MIAPAAVVTALANRPEMGWSIADYVRSCAVAIITNIPSLTGIFRGRFVIDSVLQIAT